MGIYIKDIEMPKNHNYVTITIWSNGAASYGLHDRGESLVDFRNVEVVPVPPHGRLGDLDKLENGLRHMAKYQHGERQQGILGCCETIRMAPVVIPAEPITAEEEKNDK